MDERDLQAEEPCPGLLVDEIGAGPRELDQRRAEIAHLVRNMMHTGPALRQEPPHGRVGAERGEQLDATRADTKRRRLDALLGDRLAMLETGAEEPLVGRDRLVEVGHRDAEVVDAARRHGVDANDSGSVGRDGTHRADGLARMRLGLEVGDERLDLLAHERLLLEQRSRDAVERAAVLVQQPQMMPQPAETEIAEPPAGAAQPQPSTFEMRPSSPRSQAS